VGKVYLSEAGDKCDSNFEVDIINDLIVRGVPYEHHPFALEYNRHVRSGYCLTCDGDKVAKGALYEPDLWLPGPDIHIELKGGDIKQASRGRLRDVVKRGNHNLYFIFRDNRKIRGTKMRHRSWAEKLVPADQVHIGMEVPESWLTTDQ
jgi:hypothetical protein